LVANQPGSLTLDPSILMTRLRQRGIRTQYFREYYIPFRMSPDRLLDLELQIEPQAATPTNRDFTPIAYYFDVVLWSSRFHSHWRGLLESLARLRFNAVAGAVALGLLALALIAALYERVRIVWDRSGSDFAASHGGGVKPPLHHHHATLGLCVAAMGFTLLGLEVLLLLGFQALYGYVYQQLAILVALFMVGMAAGAWVALNSTKPSGRSFPRKRESSSQTGVDPRFHGCDGGGDSHLFGRTASPHGLGMTAAEYLKLALLQLLAAGTPLLLYALFVSLESVRSLAALRTTSQVVFPALALIAGLMGGYQFPLASRLYFAGPEEPRTSKAEVRATSSALNAKGNPGILYGLDLLGACLGAVALSAYLLPVYGFRRTAILMAVVNLGPAALTALAASEAWFRRTQWASDWSARQRQSR
jgi:spermidine synthase